MSNVLKDVCRFVTIPRDFVDGHLRDLSGSAIKLYLLLFGLAQKHSAVEIELPSYEARDYTGMHRGETGKAGRELEAAGLVKLKKGPSSVMTYVLLNPETRAPLPVPEGRRGLRRHHPKAGRSARTAHKVERAGSPTVRPPTWDEIAGPGYGKTAITEPTERGGRNGPDVGKTDTRYQQGKENGQFTEKTAL